MDLLLAAHGVALAATLQHETLDRGMPPTGADVEVALQYGPVMVAFQCGNVRVRPATYRVGRLDGPTEYAFQAQDLHYGSEPRDQTFVALHSVYLVCQVGGESASELPKPCISEPRNATATQKSAMRPVLKTTGVEPSAPMPSEAATAAGYPATNAAVATATFGRASIQAIPSAARK